MNNGKKTYLLSILFGIIIFLFGVWLIINNTNCYIAKGISPTLLENLFCQFLPFIPIIGLAMIGGSIIGLWHYNKTLNSSK